MDTHQYSCIDVCPFSILPLILSLRLILSPNFLTLSFSFFYICFLVMYGCVWEELQAMKEGLNDIIPPELLAGLTEMPVSHTSLTKL